MSGTRVSLGHQMSLDLDEGACTEVFQIDESGQHGEVFTRRWVVERSFGWAARFRRLARDYERLASTLGAYHWLAFTSLMLNSLFAKSA